MILKKKWTPGAHLLLKCYLKGKISRKFANGQNIDYSEKRKWPKGFICPCTGVKYHNTHVFKYVYWYMKQISGERLQDHWSSGFIRPAHASVTRQCVTAVQINFIRPKSSAC